MIDNHNQQCVGFCWHDYCGKSKKLHIASMILEETFIKQRKIIKQNKYVVYYY